MPSELIDHINAKHRRTAMAQIIAGIGMGLSVVALMAIVLGGIGA